MTQRIGDVLPIAPGDRVYVTNGLSKGAYGTVQSLAAEHAELGMPMWLVEVDGTRTRQIRADFLQRVAIATWSGEVMGIKVHLLDDGRRIIDADDLARAFELVGDGTLDPSEFGKAMASFMAGATPSGSEGSHG